MPYATNVQLTKFRKKLYGRNGSVDDRSETHVFDQPRSGSSVANYRDRIAKGLNASSAYTRDVYSVDYSPVFAESRWVVWPSLTQYVDTYSGVIARFGVLNHLSSVNAEMEAEALSRLYDRLRAQKSYVNGLNFVGELRETLGMIRRPLDAMRSGLQRLILLERTRIKQIRRIERPSRRRDEFAKMASGTTLEINFGLRPLFSEIKDIAEAAASLQFAPNPRDRLKSTVIREFGAEQRDPRYYLQSPYMLLASTRRVIKTEVLVGYTVGCETASVMASSGLQRVSDTFGFTAENVIPTAYELTPWSWLIDYFANLGDIVNAATTDTSSVRWISKVTRQFTTLTCEDFVESPKSSIESNTNWFYQSHKGGLFTSKQSRTTLQRTVPSTLGLPPLVFSHPGESFGKIANMISVMEQHRKSIRF